MANRNLKPKDVEEELGKGRAPRNFNPLPRRWKKRNPGEVRAKKETEKRDEVEYPGSKE